MPEPSVKIAEARQDGLNIYYRVFVDGVEKPSIVFVTAPDRTIHGEAALQAWCERNLGKLDSGKVVEATLSDAAKA